MKRIISSIAALLFAAFLFGQNGKITPDNVKPVVGVGRTTENAMIVISAPFRGQTGAPIWAHATDVIDVFGSAGFAVMPVPEDTTAVDLYLPAHGWTADTLAAYPGGVLPLDYRNQKATAQTELSTQNKYVIGIVSPDTVRVRFQGLIYRPSHNLSITSPIYYLTDVGAVSDTVQGTVESQTFIVVDSNYLFLSEIGIKAANNSAFVPDVSVPSAAISVFGGDPLAPTDTIMQVIAELYHNAGRIKPGSRLMTNFSTISKNPAYHTPGNLPNTPSQIWQWNGVIVTRIKELVVSIDLQATAYGGSGLLPLNPLVPAGSSPTDSEVLSWYNDNNTNNKLVLFNGAQLYWIGSGTAANPDFIWQLQDDFSSTFFIKRVKEPASFSGTVTGLAEWSVDTTYENKESTIYEGQLYQSKTGANIGNTPNDTSKWILITSGIIKESLIINSSDVSDKVYNLTNPLDNISVQISVKDESTNYNYLLQSNSIINIGNGRYADSIYLESPIELNEINNEWVVKGGLDMSSNYHINSFDDFNNKRFFRGSSVYFKGRKYNILSAPINVKTGQELTPDSIICIPVKDAATWSINLLAGVTDFRENGSIDPQPDMKVDQTNNTLDGSIGGMITSLNGIPVHDTLINDNELITQSGGVNNIPLYVNTGDTLTLSYDIKIKGDSVSVFVGPRVGSRMSFLDGVNTITDTNEKWIRVSGRYIGGSTIDGNIRPTFNFNMGGNDTVYLARIKFELGSKESDFTLTVSSKEETKGQLFAVLDDLSFIPMDDLNFPDRYNTNSSRIQKAFDLQKELTNCSYVLTTKSNTVDEPLIMENGVSLVGNNQSRNQGKTIWYVDLRDDTKDAFTWVNEVTPTNYSIGQNIKGLTFRVVSKCNSVIETRSSSFGIIENVDIRANEPLQVVDSLFKYGISAIAAPGGLNGAHLTLEGCYVEDSWDFGLYLKDAKFQRVISTRVLRAYKGLYVESPGFDVENSSFEALNSSAIVATGGNNGGVNIESVYFESIGENVNGLPADVNAPIIDISNYKTFYANNLTFTATSGFSAFKFRDVLSSTIDGFNAEQANLDQFVDADCSNGQLIIRGVPQNYFDIDNDSLICKSILNLESIQRSDNSGVFSRKNNLEHIGGKLDSSLVIESLVNNSNFIGVTQFEDSIEINSFGQNWFSNSRTMSDWGDTGNLSFFKNDTTINNTPFHKAKVSSDPGTSDRIGVNPIDSQLILNEYYQFSIDVLPGNNLLIDSIGVQVSDTEPIRYTKYNPVADQVQRVYVNFKYQTETPFNSRIRVHIYDQTANAGDSIWVSNVMLCPITKGIDLTDNRVKLKYIETDGSPIYDRSSFTWKLNDDWVLSGSGKFDAQVDLPSNSTSTGDTLQVDYNEFVISNGTTIYIDPVNLSKNTHITVNNSSGASVTVNFVGSTVTVGGVATTSYVLTSGSVEFFFHDGLSNFWPIGSHN